MATFGKTSNGSSATGASTDELFASSASPSSSGAVTSISTRIWTDTGTLDWRGAIYSDSSGPGTLLAVTDDAATTQTSEGVVTANFSGVNLINIVSGTTYWIAIHWGNDGAQTHTISRAGSANLRRQTTDDFHDGSPSPFPTHTTSSGAIDAYVTYTVAGGFVGKLITPFNNNFGSRSSQSINRAGNF